MAAATAQAHAPLLPSLSSLHEQQQQQQLLQGLLSASRLRRRVVPHFAALSWTPPHTLHGSDLATDRAALLHAASVAGTSSLSPQHSHDRARARARRGAHGVADKTTYSWISSTTTTTVLLPPATVQLVASSRGVAMMQQQQQQHDDAPAATQHSSSPSSPSIVLPMLSPSPLPAVPRDGVRQSA